MTLLRPSRQTRMGGTGTHSPSLLSLSYALLAAIVFAVSLSLPALAADAAILDTFHESLHLRPLPTGRTHAAFTFTLASGSDDDGANSGSHFQLLPASLISVLDASPLPLQELHLSLNKGRWDYDAWGSPVFNEGGERERAGTQWGSHMVANGAEVWARYSRRGNQSSAPSPQQQHPHPHRPTHAEKDAFHALLSVLSGHFCSTLAAPGSREAISTPSDLTRDFYRSGSGDASEWDPASDVVLHLASSPSPCTEVLHPLLSLLPCKASAGLATLLEPHAWLRTEWHGIELVVTRSGKAPGGWKVQVKVGSVWNGPRVKEGKRDISLDAIFKRPLRSACPLASDSFVSLLAPPPGDDTEYVVGPVYAEDDATIGGQDVTEEKDEDEDDEHKDQSGDASAGHTLRQQKRLAEQLRSRGSLRWNTTDAYLPAGQALDVSLSWPGEEVYAHSRGAASPPLDLSVRRALTSSDQLAGTLTLHLSNPLPSRSRTLVTRDILPWFIDLDPSTLTFVLTPIGDTSGDPAADSGPYIRFDADLFTDPVRRIVYTPSVPRKAPAVLEMQVRVPPAVDVTLEIAFTKEVIRYEEHPPDAHRGLEVPPGTVWEVEGYGDDDEGERSEPWFQRGRHSLQGRHTARSTFKTHPSLVEVSVPDFSMPYNVVIFTSTLLALFAGSAINLLVRIFGDVRVPPGSAGAGAGAGTSAKKAGAAGEWVEEPTEGEGAELQRKGRRGTTEGGRMSSTAYARWRYVRSLRTGSSLASTGR